MDALQAYKLICSKWKQNPTVMSCREYDDFFGFDLAPPGSDPNSPAMVGFMTLVHKKDGTVDSEDDHDDVVIRRSHGRFIDKSIFRDNKPPRQNIKERTMPYELYLAHHGIKGMHWGIRRFQPYPSGKSGRYIGKKKPSIIRSAVETHKAKKAEKEAAKKAIADAKHEEERQEALNKGLPSDILKFRGEISNAEMEQAIQRIRKEQTLEELRKTESRSVEQTLDDINERVKNLNDYMNTATNLYNNYNKIKDIYSKEKSKPIEEAKKKMIRNNDIEKILKNQAKFTTDELKEAVQRNTHQKNLFKDLDSTFTGRHDISAASKHDPQRQKRTRLYYK